jgi:type II secretion system protein N
MSRSKKILLYLCFGIAAAVVFLYTLFPSETVKNLIVNGISAANPNLKISIEKVKPVLPPGIVLQDIDLEYGKMALIDAAYAKLVPLPWTLFQNRKTVSFKITTGQGKIAGQAFISSDATPSLDNLNAALSDIQLNQVAAFKAMTNYTISGVLNGTVAVNGGQHSESTARAILDVSQCTVNLLSPLFSLDKLVFSRIEAELTMNSGRVLINKCDLRGEELDGRISGTLHLQDPYEKSSLNLSGVLRPHAELIARIKQTIPVDLFSGKNIQRAGLPFTVHGTIENPGFSLR